MCIVLYIWLIGLTIPFVLSIAAWHSSRPWARKVLCPFFLVVLLGMALSHPFINLLVFRPAVEAHTKGELDRVKSMALVGESTSTVLRQLGQPDRIAITEDGEHWYYNSAPWYAYSFDDLVVSFAGENVKSVWMDYF